MTSSLSANLSRRIHLARNRRTKAYQLCRILFPSRRYTRNRRRRRRRRLGLGSGPGGAENERNRGGIEPRPTRKGEERGSKPRVGRVSVKRGL